MLLANFAILYIIAVSGLDILFGYSGQISMGHAAFYCIGAYGSVLIHQFTGLPVIVTILMGTVIATLIGALLAVPLTAAIKVLYKRYIWQNSSMRPMTEPPPNSPPTEESPALSQ